MSHTLEIKSKKRANMLFIGALIFIGAQFGSYTTVSVYIMSLMEKLNCSLTQVTLLFSVASFAGIFANFAVSALIDKVSIKLICAAGAILFGAFFVILAVTNSLTMLYVAGALFGFGTNLAGFPAMQAAVSWWHAKGVGKKLSMLSMCMYLVGVVLGLVLPRLLGAVGLNSTLLIQGTFFTAIMLVAAFFLMSDKPEKYGLHAYGIEESAAGAGGANAAVAGMPVKVVFRTSQFWILILINVAVMFGTGFVNNASTVYQAMGVDAVTAGTMLSVNSGLAIVWTFLFGVSIDKLGPKKATIIFIAGTAIEFAAAGIIGGFPGALILVAFIGIFNSYSGMINAVTLPMMYGAKPLGQLLPLANIAASVGVIIGPPLATMMYESSGSFSNFFLLLAIVAILIIVFYQMITSSKSLAFLQSKME